MYKILFLSLFLSLTSVISAEVRPESLVNIFQRLETLEKKVRDLHGQNEVLNHQLNQLKKAQKNGFLNIDERIDTLSNTKKSAKAEEKNNDDKAKEETVKIVDYQPTVTAEKSPASSPETSKKVADPVSTPKTETTAPAKIDPAKEEIVAKTQEQNTAKPRAPSAYEKEVYQQAFILMKTSPSAATKAFRDYIKLQPDSPLAANSQYWIGEIMYSHNNYKGAVQEFIKVLQQYKTSDKAPDAAIKLGYSFYALKNWDFARRTFNDVLKYFPNNQNAVNLAKKRLEKMSAAGH